MLNTTKLFCLLLLFFGLCQDLSAQDELDTNGLFLKAKLFALAEFDQFDTIPNTIYKPSILKAKGFKDIIFVKIKARGLYLLMSYAINKKRGNVDIPLDSAIYQFTDPQSIKKAFKRLFGVDSINESNLDSIEKLLGENGFINNQFGLECDYIIAFTKDRCYLLKGFGNNQFKDFFDDCIRSGDNLLLDVREDKMYIKKRFEQILDNSIEVDEFDMLGSYKYFIEKKSGEFPQCKPCTDRMVIYVH